MNCDVSGFCVKDTTLNKDKDNKVVEVMDDVLLR